MIVGSSQLWKKILLCRLFETDKYPILIYYQLSLQTLMAFYLRFQSSFRSLYSFYHTKNLNFSIQIANTSGFRTKHSEFAKFILHV
jgi:hypothetical protein